MRSHYIYKGDLAISSTNIAHWQDNLREIKCIDGSLDIYHLTNVNLPRLQIVKKNVTIHNLGKQFLKIKSLQYIGGNLHITRLSKVIMNKLVYVAGDFFSGDDSVSATENLKTDRWELYG